MPGDVPAGSLHDMAKARLDRDGALGIITLDNPPLNTIGDELIADLLAALAQIEGSPGLRALLIRGEGKVFSAGADVNVFAGREPGELRPLIASFLDLGRRVEQLPIPTLAALHGTAQAGGFELALFCDLVWAAEGTMLGLPETRIGIVPLAGGIERVAARAGLGRAKAIALGGELYTAEQFAAWGVIDRALPADELHAEAERFGRQLADGPTRAFAVVKELAEAYLRGGVAGADALLLDRAVALFDSEDAREGIDTFLATGRAKGSFSGR